MSPTWMPRSARETWIWPKTARTRRSWKTSPLAVVDEEDLDVEDVVVDVVDVDVVGTDEVSDDEAAADDEDDDEPAGALSEAGPVVPAVAAALADRDRWAG